MLSVTDIGLMARYDHDRIVVMATRLQSGKPLNRVQLELRDREGKVLWHGATASDGTASLPGRRGLDGRPPFVLWGSRGRDTAFVMIDGRDAAGSYISYNWYSFFAFDHRELRDDRVEIFSDRLPSGVYEYTYLARATSLGRFVAAPTKAKEMYRPETFGRSGTTFVEVR